MLKELGTIAAFSDLGVSYSRLPMIKGASTVVSSDPDGLVMKKVARALGDFLTEFGYGTGAPARHLYLLSEQEGWHPSHDEVVKKAFTDYCGSAGELGLLEGGHVKNAMSRGFGLSKFIPVVGRSSIGALGAFGLLSLIAGGAAGSAAWKLRRELGEDETGLEATKGRIAHYDRLAEELDRKMKDRHEY